jgi:hypothetical protein
MSLISYLHLKTRSNLGSKRIIFLVLTSLLENITLHIFIQTSPLKNGDKAPALPLAQVFLVLSIIEHHFH